MLASTLQRGFKRTLIAGAAVAIGQWIERSGCSPQDLEEAIVQRRPLLQVALQEVPPEAWIGTKSVIKSALTTINDQDYLEILKVLSDRYPEHALVLARHGAWYREQMEYVRKLLLDP